MIEEALRWVSTVTITVAAVLSTVSWQRWAHSLIRPGMAYTTVVLWTVAAYRWWLTAFHIEPGTALGPFIRAFVSVAFFAMSVGFIIHALATREYDRTLRRSNGDR